MPYKINVHKAAFLVPALLASSSLVIPDILDFLTPSVFFSIWLCFNCAKFKIFSTTPDLMTISQVSQSLIHEEIVPFFKNSSVRVGFDPKAEARSVIFSLV
jgi:hypothetical protein